jgi:uncharacterized membrane protein YcaP (DUF421 family)
MDWLWRVDWAGLYEPKHALLDVFLRGTIMYLMIFVLLRLVVRRQTGGIGITDILVIVLIAEVTGNGISDNFQSIGESATLVCTILFWSTLFEWLQSRYPAFEGWCAIRSFSSLRTVARCAVTCARSLSALRS